MNRKNNLLFKGLIGILSLSFLVTSCSPDYETDFEVKSLKITNRDLSPIAFAIEGGQKEIRVETNVPLEMWRVSSNADWCKVEKQQEKAIISASRNEMYGVRHAEITIAYGHQSYNIDVAQTGLQASILIEGKTRGIIKEISSKGGKISTTVESNVAIDHISIPDTAAWVKLEKTEENGTQKTLHFTIDPSYDSRIRYSTITLQSSQDFSKITSFVIKQEKKVWGNPISIPLTSEMLSANATQSGDGQGLPGLVDNNKNTFYHTLYSQASPGGKPHYLQFNLNEPLRFLKIEYISRNGGNGSGDVKRAGIWISKTGTDNDSDWTKAATVTFNLPSKRGVQISANEVANLGDTYKYIRFIPEARRDADPINSSGKNGWWNMADIFLYTFTD